MSDRKFASMLLSVALGAGLVAGSGITAAADQPATNHRKVPQSLQDIESKTEDVIDLAASGNWSQVSKDVAEITSSWETYKQQSAGQPGTPQPLHQSFASALDRLRSAAASKNADQTMQSANNLSAIVVDLYELYNPAIPTDIGRLDLLERQVVLDTRANNVTAAAQSLGKVKTVWSRLKPSVEAKNGQALARQFEQIIEDQSRPFRITTRRRSPLTPTVRSIWLMDSRSSMPDVAEKRGQAGFRTTGAECGHPLRKSSLSPFPPARLGNRYGTVLSIQ